MIDSALNFLADGTVGIIGCGHLGRTLAEALIDHGIRKEKLMISYGESPSTLDRIKVAGLLENVSDNEEICRKSDIIFIAVRPESIGGLRKLSFPKSAIVVSCMAGVSKASLKKVLGIDAFRIMPSGPDTIKARKGIVAVYPPDDFLINILSCIGLKVYEISDEESMHAFTAGVCLPAAILVAEKKGLDTDQTVRIIGREYPDFEEIYTWARGVLPYCGSEQEEYIRRMSTKGGITEAIIDSLNSGDSFLCALRKGIARSREISARVTSLM
jgi:pyrroline-5-carboxylate reductase